MKIILKHYGVTYSIETKEDDFDATEMINTFNNLMLSAGWQQDSIDEAIMALNEEIDL
jgi:hypothetical protein